MRMICSRLHITLKVKESESRLVESNSLRPCGLYSLWNSRDQNTGVGSLSLLQGIFPTQGSNPGLPHGRRIPYQLSHKESRRILEWVAYPFSSGSSWPRNWTRVSCIAGRFFISRATREAHIYQDIGHQIEIIIHIICFLRTRTSSFPLHFPSLSLSMVLLELFYVHVWYSNVTSTSVCSLSRISYLSIQCWW